MNCQFCGKTINEGSEYCSSCGRRISLVKDQANTASQPTIMKWGNNLNLTDQPIDEKRSVADEVINDIEGLNALYAEAFHTDKELDPANYRFIHQIRLIDLSLTKRGLDSEAINQLRVKLYMKAREFVLDLKRKNEYYNAIYVLTALQMEFNNNQQLLKQINDEISECRRFMPESQRPKLFEQKTVQQNANSVQQGSKQINEPPKKGLFHKIFGK